MISFIIRTYNEAAHIGRLIDAIRSQNGISEKIEVIVIDSGSNDGTLNIAKSRNVNIIEIPKAEFNYSYALNLGIENSAGELLVIMSAHSIPPDTEWLSKVISHFKDFKVAGMYCRQIPWPDAEWREVSRLEHAFKKKSARFNKENNESGMQFSNAASCIRRSVWEKHKFVIMPASEDMEWAKWAIDNGYDIIYDADALVYHSHNETCRNAAKRIIDIEKSIDITSARKRNLLLTFKQASRWFLRDSRNVFMLSYSRKNLFKNILDCAKRSLWYIADFNRK